MGSWMNSPLNGAWWSVGSLSFDADFEAEAVNFVDAVEAICKGRWSSEESIVFLNRGCACNRIWCVDAIHDDRNDNNSFDWVCN